MSEQAFYLDPEFWVLVSFVGFLLLAFRPLARMITRALDARSAQIAEELAEARRLREEAQAVLASYQKKQRESLKEAEEILAGAKTEAEFMSKQAEAQLKTALDKRMKLAIEKIAQAESKALQDVQNHVVDIAVSVARSIITDHLVRTGNDDMIKQVASELERKFH